MMGFPSGLDGGLQCRRRGFDPWVRKILWRREWQPTPVFFPRKFHGPRSLVGYSPWGHKESDTTEQLTWKKINFHVLFYFFKESNRCCSVQFSCLVVSNSLRPRGLQHTRFPVHRQLPELIQTHVHQVGDAIQPSHPLSSPYPPTFNLSQHHSFPMNQFFASSGQSIGVSASASVFPVNIQDWFPLGLTGCCSCVV